MSFFSKDNKWQKKSYSQSGEDLIVKFIFELIGVNQPSYIDIGAHHPFNLSNTAIFYENGSKGINIEPDPQLFKEFVNYRKRDVNLNCGISDKEGELTLNVLNASTLNTFSKAEAEKFVNENNFKIAKQLQVKVFRIHDILNKYWNGKFPDFMSLDAEGFDEVIIKSIDFEKSKPIVICLETMSYSENGTGEKNHQLIDYLKSKGYLVFADTYLNTIFLRKDRWIRNS